MIAILPIQPDVLQLIDEETELAAEGAVWGYLAADGKTMLGYVIVEKAEPVRVIALQCEDFAIADGLPFGPPHSGLEQMVFRAPAYKRADIGMSYRLYDRGNRKSPVKNAWLGIDCLNLFGINNVNSYYWVTDVTNQQYGVPNYLTGRQINVKLSVAL